MSEKYITGKGSVGRAVRSRVFSINSYVSPIANDFIYGFDEMVTQLEPDLALDTRQTSGSTVPDISGNSFDFTAVGVEATDFRWYRNLSVFPYGQRLNTTATSGLTRTGLAAFDNQHSGVIAMRGPYGWAGHYIMDVSSDRFAVTGSTGSTGVFDSGARYWSYEGGDESEFMVGYTYEENNEVTHYINGLPVATIAPTANPRDIIAGATWTFGQRFSGSNKLNYQWYGMIYKNALITAEEHYESWLRMTQMPHHYKTHIEGTSLETGLVRNVPMWETDGPDGMDISGNAGHMGLTSIITGGPPIELGFRTGFRSTGATGSLSWNPGFNLQTDSFSIAWVSCEPISTSRGVFGINDVNDNVYAAVIAGQWQLTVTGGGAGSNDRAGPTISARDINRMVLTFDQPTKTAKLYRDGVEICSVDFTALAFADTSAYQWRLNHTPGLTGGFNLFTGYYEWNRAITPAEAADVWAAPEIGSYPPPETKYVAADATGGTIPDSSGNSNGAAVLEGLAALVGDEIVLDKANASDFIRLEAGIATQVAASQKWTYAMVGWCEEGSALWAINNSGGGNLNLMLYSSGGMTHYQPSAVAVTDRANNRAPFSLVVSYDKDEAISNIVLNGVLLWQGPIFGSVTTFNTTDLWSFGQEYDAPTPGSNWSTATCKEIQLWDEYLTPEQCINVSKDMFNRYYR